MMQLPELPRWRDGTDPEQAEREVRWLSELIADADQAIEAQRRIMAHDGPLEAHRLSLASLEASQRQLQTQLARIMEQRDIEVLDFALDGPRYARHRARAETLAGFLHSMQQLYQRVGQAMSMSNPGPRIPLNIASRCQIEVAGFFPSSFGVRFAAPTAADFDDGHSLTTLALEATFDLVNATNPLEHVERVGPWAMKKYGHLVTTLVHAEATPKATWLTPAGRERRWIIDDNALRTLHNRLAKIHHEQPAQREATGVMTGASLRRHRFELSTDGGVVTGAAPEELKAKITRFFGKPCHIVFIETRYIDDTTEQEKRSRVLVDITDA